MPEDEGIRLIAPDEAAEVAERDDAAQRRGDGVPRYGDRPPPPGGPRPALRFPLTETGAPGPIEPLQVAPVTRPAAPGSHEPLASSEPPAPDDDEDRTVVSVESGDDELLHWTEPATGEVPAVRLDQTPPPSTRPGRSRRRSGAA